MKFQFSQQRFLRLLAIVAMGLAPATLVQAEDEKSEGASTAEAKHDVEPVAIYGTPKVDGEIDEAWEHAVEFDVSKPATSETTIAKDKMATAKVKLMWDAEHLYALFQVKDPKLSDSSFEDHQQDSIEFFVDELNEKAGSYQDDDAQYRVSYKGKVSGGESTKTENLTAVTKTTDDGYLVELSVKLHHLKPEAGKKVGIELQVNDDPGTGSRGAVAKWHHDENDSYLSTSDFGTVTLKEKAE